MTSTVASRTSGDYGLPAGVGRVIQDVERGMRSAATGFTARAGGGQAEATKLTAAFNRVTTVATEADSVKLPPAVVGQQVVVKNAGANSMDVFPATGEFIDAGAADAAKAVAAGKACAFYCAVAGKWDSLLGA